MKRLISIILTATLIVSSGIISLIYTGAVSNNLVANGSFEDGMNSWGVNEGGVWEVTDEAAATGSKSIKVNGGSDWLYNKITLEANTSYTLTFKMLGTVKWMNYGVGTSPSNRSVLSQGFWKQIDNWETFTAVFDTTDATEYYVSFYGENTTCYIDDVVVTKNDGEKQIVTNGSFEYGMSSWGVNDGGVWEVTDEAAATGSKSIKVNGGSDWLYNKITLEANTSYRLTFKMLGTVRWMNYGIGTSPSNRSVLSQGFWKQIDNWETFTAVFDTADATEYYVSFYGENTTCYIDDVEIKKVEIKDTGIVKNADFSRGLKEWTHTNWTVAADGDNTCAMLASDTAPWISQDVTLESGKLYKFTFDYKGTQYWAQYKLTQKESGKQIFGGLYTTSDDWKTTTVYFIAPESGTYTVAFDDEDTAPTYIDNVYITDSDISAGDIDENGSVENTDLVLLKKLLLGVGEKNVFADANCDGNIDIKDLISLKKLLAK